jgi:putrescine transport system permease protein
VTERRPFILYTLMAFGYAFLYLPIATVIAYSFNESRMVTVWGGFSTKWYGELFRNEQVLDAAGLSLLIAVLSSTLAVIIGTLAGLALARFGSYRGRGMLSLMTSAPLVMPDVMLGISALFLFITLQQLTGWPDGRGMDTITIAHVTLCVCYVTIIVRSRLVQMDLSLEEAAMDLGARPWKVFFVITLPLIWPALVAGWLLAFTLSLDDVVIASFTSGPGSSTLPIVVLSKVRFGVTPEINALATLMIVAVAVGVTVAGWVMHRGRGKA